MCVCLNNLGPTAINFQTSYPIDKEAHQHIPVSNQSFFRSARVTQSPGPQSTSHLRLGLPKDRFTLCFPTKILYAFLDCSLLATCPTHLSRFDLRFLIM